MGCKNAGFQKEGSVIIITNSLQARAGILAVFKRQVIRYARQKFHVVTAAQLRPIWLLGHCLNPTVIGGSPAACVKSVNLQYISLLHFFGKNHSIYWYPGHYFMLASFLLQGFTLSSISPILEQARCLAFLLKVIHMCFTKFSTHLLQALVKEVCVNIFCFRPTMFFCNVF